MLFDMEATTLSTLGNATSSASGDLGANVRLLYQAALPLEGKFNGAGRQAFDNFKADADSLAIELDRALRAVLAGIDGQDVAFVEGEESMVDETTAMHAGAPIDASVFGAGR